jgi:nucleolar protein 12
MSSLTEQLFGASTGSGSSLAFKAAKKTNLDLFAVAPQVKKESRRDKRRRLEDEALGVKSESKGKTSTLLDNVELIPVPEKESASRHAAPKRLRHALHRDNEEEKRTVFIGNLPNDIDKKEILKAFKDCGDIESVRIRNQALEEEREKKRGRAVRVLRGELKKGAQYSASGFILFKKQHSTNNALAKSGLVISGRHVFVTRVDDEAKSFPPQTSIFLGNLSYDTNEEQVWQYFVDHGVADVRRVRLVRDKETGDGKGFGYVEFAKPDSANKAITTRGDQLNGRDVRICHVTKDKKIASKTTQRREIRKNVNAAAVSSGPMKPGQQRAVKVQREVVDTPSWMGLATNPRKKLARDLRPLITDSGPKKSKRDAQRSRSGPPKKAAPKKPSS